MSTRRGMSENDAVGGVVIRPWYWIYCSLSSSSCSASGLLPVNAIIFRDVLSLPFQKLSQFTISKSALSGMHAGQIRPL